jgi:inorganic pyrophosphatase
VTQRQGKAERERNDRVLFVPSDAAKLSHVRELPKRVRKELEAFFVAAVERTPKKLKLEGWEGPDVAEGLVAEAAARYASSGSGSGASLA